MLNLAHLLLWVWADNKGQSAPTIIDIGCYFEEVSHWTEAVNSWLASLKSETGAAQALLSDAILLWKKIGI